MQPLLQSPPKIRSSTSVNFHLPIRPLPFNKIILTIPTNTLFLYISAIFNLPIFKCNHPSNLHQIYFPYLLQETKEPWSLARNDTVSICSFFLEVWTVIAGITIPDSLSLRFANWCIAGNSL